MNDLTITYSRIRKELSIFLIFLITAFFINLYAIIVYEGAWIELITQLHIVFFLSLFFYVFTGLIRFIIFFSRLLIKKRRVSISDD